MILRPWKARSIVLRKFNYPELAPSDAYKAVLLCDAAIDGGSRRVDVLLHFTMATWQKKSSNMEVSIRLQTSGTRNWTRLKDEKVKSALSIGH